MTSSLNQFEKQEALDVLNCRIRACEKCSLSTTREHALVGEGNVEASVLFVALSPGAKENLENKMFIGPSGRVLNKLLKESGIERESVFMTNLVKCILPKNRKPKLNEIDSCSSFLDEEISIVQPKIIVPLGYYATRSILIKYQADISSVEKGFKNVNGQLLMAGGMKIFPITHPSALLYHPSFESVTIEKYKVLKTLL